MNNKYVWAAGLIALCTAVFFVFGDSKLVASGKKYVDENVPIILSTWSLEELTSRASDEMIELISADRLPQVLARISRIGELEKCSNFKHDAALSKKFALRDAVTLVYVAKANFENGPADIQIQLIQKDEKWKLYGLNVISPFHAKADHEQSQRNKCNNNMRMIGAAKDQAALTLNYKTGDALREEEITSYLQGGFSGLVCPKQGSYTINPVGNEAECSEHGSLSESLAGSVVNPRQESARTRAVNAQVGASQRTENLDKKRQANAVADAEKTRLEQEQQAKLAAEADAARIEQERQAKLAAEAEAARLASSRKAPPDVPVTAPMPVGPTTEYKLSGIMKAKGNYMALINNRVVNPGDSLGMGNILTIDRQRVTIRSIDGTIVELCIGRSVTGRAPQDDDLVLQNGISQGWLKSARSPASVSHAEGGRVGGHRDTPLRNSPAQPTTAEPEDFAYTSSDNEITITKYNGPGGAVSIPRTINALPVVRIGKESFLMCANLTNVTIPEGVTEIASVAFLGCTSLTNVAFPRSVTNIGSQSFKSCTSLTSITIPSSVDRTGSSAFYNCTKLTNVTIEKGVTRIGSGMFKGCTDLTGITIPDTVISIGDEAFLGCTSLTEVTVPDGVTSIGMSAFSMCSSLRRATISDSVIFIGTAAFSNCSSLEEVIIGKRVAEIKDSAFASCSSLKNVTIPDSVTRIGRSLFENCTGLASATIGKGIISLGSYQFKNCTSLAYIILPDGLVDTGYSVFANCRSLTNISIPERVSRIWAYEFSSCSSLMAITVDVSNPAYSSLDGVLFDKNQIELIQYPPGKRGTCTIPASVTKIGDLAFRPCSNLTAITVDEGNSIYSSIGGVLFNKRKTMLVQCPPGTVGNYAIPDGTQLISSYAFASCAGLTRVVIPDSVSSIGEEAFSSCTNLKEIYFKGKAPETAGESIFRDSGNVTVYYDSDATGFKPKFGGRPTALRAKGTSSKASKSHESSPHEATTHTVNAPSSQSTSPTGTLSRVMIQMAGTPNPELLAELVDWDSVFREADKDLLAGYRILSPMALRAFCLQFLKQPSVSFKRPLNNVIRASAAQEKMTVDSIEDAFSRLDVWLLSEIHQAFAGWKGARYSIGEAVINGEQATVKMLIRREDEIVRVVARFTNVGGRWLLMAEWLPKLLAALLEEMGDRDEMDIIQHGYRALCAAAEGRAQPERWKAILSLKPCYTEFAAAVDALELLSEKDTEGAETSFAKSEEAKARRAITRIHVVMGGVRNAAVEAAGSDPTSTLRSLASSVDEMEQRLTSAKSDYLEAGAMLPTAAKDQLRGIKKNELSIAKSKETIARMGIIDDFFGETMATVLVEISMPDSEKVAEGRRKVNSFQKVLSNYVKTLRGRPDDDKERQLVLDAQLEVNRILQRILMSQ